MRGLAARLWSTCGERDRSAVMSTCMWGAVVSTCMEYLWGEGQERRDEHLHKGRRGEHLHAGVVG